MTTKIRIIGAPTGPSILYEMLKVTAGTDVEYGGPTNEYVIVDSYEDLEPCQPSIKDFDDRYRGKCKRLRKEARGW